MSKKYFEHLPVGTRRIPGCLAWAGEDGSLYGIETRMLKNRFNGQYYKHGYCGWYFEYAQRINELNGYKYSSVKRIINASNEEYANKTIRSHIAVAMAHIPNPDNLPVVGHKNNIKHDNRVENLYWTTYSENTQKAVDDGLLVNDVGYDDSQSHPVYMIDAYTDEIICDFGSAKQAALATGVSSSTVMRHAVQHIPIRKPFYFRFQDDPDRGHDIIVEYRMDDDSEVGRYFNMAEASRRTGVCNKTIEAHCRLGRKPMSRQTGDTYFMIKSTLELNGGKNEL